MHNKKFLFLVILILVVGFASVSTVLYITGNLAIATSDDFDVYFSGAILDGEDKSNELVVDKNHIIYKTKELKKVNDESVLEYKITNGSTQYDADVVITCTPSSTVYYDVTPTPSSLTVEAGHVGKGIIIVKQKKYSTEIIEEEFECELVANAIERTSIGDDVITNDDYAIEGVLKDKERNILPNTYLVVYSNIPHVVKTDRNGYFYVDGLEKGIHEIYLKTDADINDKELVKNASSFSATLTTNNIYKVTKGDYIIDDHNTGLELDDKSVYCEYEVGKIWDYNYTGSYEEFKVIEGCSGTYKIELWGAQGGNSNDGALGGKGAYTSGEIDLKEKNILYIYVGEQGKALGVNSAGYNGGGITTGYYYTETGTATYEPGGGGATDVRLTSGTWNNFDSLKSRIMVAAGGGGAASYHVVGGPAGGLIGYQSGICSRSDCLNNVAISATGGAQTNGGVPGKDNCDLFRGKIGYYGTFGSGGSTLPLAGWASGGGGAGYYGGGGGIGHHTQGGGGGSSFISGHNGCDAIDKNSTSTNIIHTGQSMHYSEKIFTNTVMIDGQGYKWTTTKGSSSVGMPTHDGTSTMTGNSGNGYAKITLVSLD